MTPVPVVNARRVATVMLQHSPSADHLRHQLEWGRPLPVVAKEAEGLFKAFRRSVFRDMPEAIAWLAVAMIVRDVMSGKREEDAL
jgi:hypothetical protein